MIFAKIAGFNIRQPMNFSDLQNVGQKSVCLAVASGRSKQVILARENLVQCCYRPQEEMQFKKTKRVC